MTDLIAYVSSGPGTIAYVEKVIEGEEFETVFIITNPEFKKEIPKLDNIEVIVIDNKRVLPEMIEEIKNKLKDKIKIMETAVNIVSGSGKEHMALLSALLKLGCGIRFVALTKEGVREV